MHYPDFSPYVYGHTVSDGRTVNIGWLEAGHDYPVGPVSKAFSSALEALVRNPTELYRGYHECSLCQPPQGVVTPEQVQRWRMNQAPRGNGEVRVTGADGSVYAAPVLVLHYVLQHGYQPPLQFVSAVVSKHESAA